MTDAGPLNGPFQIHEGPFSSYFQVLDSSGDEIDVYGANSVLTETPWIGPTFLGAELYSCQTATCVIDFVSPDVNPAHLTTPPFYGINLSGPVHLQTTVTAVPETGTLGLLSFGLMGIALWQWKQAGPRTRLIET
jgi:hypothetical protein